MIEVREARPEDVAGIFDVRVSVRENHLDLEQLRQRGITPDSVARDFEAQHRKGFVAEDHGRVVGFCIGDADSECVWALFVLPAYEGRGLGRRLLGAVVDWLWECGAQRVWLTTGPATRAARFYRHLGWQEAGRTPYGELRFELTRPADADQGAGAGQ
jgi:GNAT superfamily N-acetyltransferase